jgi:SAM-dependent methyltransferase
MYDLRRRDSSRAQRLIVLRRPRFIARQAAHPSGLCGRVLGAIMAVETRALNDEVLRHLAAAPGERILEIGFGHGRTLERAAKASPGARFAGIDHAEDMVAIYRVLRSGGRLVLAFKDRTPEVEASAPPDIYHLRSRDEVRALLATAGFETSESAGPGGDLWIADARKR